MLSDDLRAGIEDGLHEARGTMAEETVRALRKGVTAFAAWCAPRGFCPLPAVPDVVAAYVDDLHEQGRKPAGIRQAVWAIGRLHTLARLESPTEDQVVALAMKRAVRASGSRQRQAAPLGELAVARIQATTGLKLSDLRDLAMLLVARDLLARRSEVVALQVEDLEFATNGTATALIRRSKTDQAGEGVVLFLGHSTVKALRDWLNAAGIVAGPIFRPVNKGGRVGADALDPSKVATILKRMAGRAGLDASRVSGHSCRVGMAQDLVASGADTAAVQQAGRWKTPVMPARYVEHLKAGRGAVARYHQRRGK
ncbi:site-specific integrase [Paracraurococcus lichenis]|uniref:Site-specific integrase n=1 Tax=Paracraurococcus lichenis TaxID=3064888 RepID=A0ABT9EBK8_9PROT|nr:site-specific integrase [Paracraurococcus sp. LOR1-02]MDO9713586.1 site-specific integrase [Paracraurococcus sp. LOR1-02]